jgi:WD40 repeat protein
VGFKDKLVLYHILIDGLKSYREMSCKSPVKIIAFSEGGRYLAVAIANGISVYSTFQDSDTSTFLLESCFIGHTGPLQCLTWAGGKLFSAGADRNIFGWDMHTGVRIDNFNVLRSSGACMSVAVATSCTLLRVATCTTDGALHKIEWSGRSADESSTTLLCGPSNENKITTVCLSQDKSTLFAATMNGVVKIYSWLSGDDPTHIVHQVALHCNYSLVSLQRSIPLVSRMMCSGPFLISTGGNDGSLMLSEYSSSQSPPRVPPPSIINEDIVLIRIDVYEETKELINELKRNIKTLKSDHDFELHSKEVIWKNIFSEQKDQAGETFIAER